MRYVLGVDGGNNKTHAVLAAETGEAVGFGQGGPSNHHICGIASATKEIEKAARGAIELAGVGVVTPDMGCFCLAGADLPEDYEVLQKSLDDLRLTNRTLIKNDTTAALRAGLTQPWGVVVICGTGFNAAARSPNLLEISLPALGPLSGDWGGGGDLGIEMVRLVMRAWDGRGEATLLTPLVLNALKADSMDRLLSRVYHHEIGEQELLDLVPHLFEVALEGDAVASGLIIRMGTEVGVGANALIRRLSMQHLDVEVVLGGSVFKGKGPLFIDTIQQVVHRVCPGARLITLQYEPVLGAVLMGLEALGVEIDSQVRNRVETGLSRMGL